MNEQRIKRGVKWQRGFSVLSLFKGRNFKTLSVIGALFCISCSHEMTQDLEQTEAKPEPLLIEPILRFSEFNRSDFSAHYGSIEKFTLKQEVLEQKRKELSQLGMHEIDLTQAHGTRAYELRSPGNPAKIILKPKMVFRSSLFGDRAHIEERENSDLSISVNVAFADGMVSQIPTGLGSQSLPRQILIANPTQFIADLTARISAAPEFLSKIPCPESIRISLGDQSFPVRFNTHLISCPVNTFFPAEILLSRAQWKTLKRGFLRAGALEVEAEIDLSAPVVTEYVNFTLHKRAIHSFLDAHLAVLGIQNSIYGVRKSQSVLNQLLAELQRELQTDFQEEQFVSFKESVVSDFFERRNPCPERENACFTLRAWNAQNPVNSYVFPVKKEQYLGRPLFLRARSLLTDELAERQPVQIRASNESPLQPVTAQSPPALSRTMRTVGEGEILEIEIERVSAGTLQLNQAVENLENYTHCRNPYSACHAGQWAYVGAPGAHMAYHVMPIVNYINANLPAFPYVSGMDWMMNKMNAYYAAHPRCAADADFATRHYPNALPLPNFPYRMGGAFPPPHGVIGYYEFQCTDLQHNQCDPADLEQRWRRTSTWSIPVAQPQFHALPAITPGEMDAVLDGWSFQFSWTEAGQRRSMLCPLRQMPVEVLGQRILVTFENNQQCAPFNAGNRREHHFPFLSVLNKSSIASEFKCGTLVEDSTGIRNYRCMRANGQEEVRDTTTAQDTAALARGEKIGLYQRYYPRLQIQTKMRNVGSYFESSEERDNL